MGAPLLTTKFYFPPARTNLVSRPRLVERLNAGLRGPLTLISAPAGYGKTSLLSMWRASDAARSYPLAWLSLDPDDNEPTRFLAYLISAIAAIKPGFGEITLVSLQAPQPPPSHVILTNLINELSELEHPLALVLDDYHLITTQSIHEVLVFLLDHLPPQMHLVILSRADPPLPLARLRARNQLTEIRAADLRFTPEEAAQFLRKMGLELSGKDIAALEERTEGWVAGLQLAAISLQKQAAEAIPGFITSFTGSYHFVLDYLVDEVLDQQPETIRSFLLRTSILERMTGSLCDAITDQTDGLSTLEALERANLFVNAQDEERNWYRYHQLFADMLRNRLMAVDRGTNPHLLPDLHHRAAVWFERNGFVSEALHHALAAGESDYAAKLVEQSALPMLLKGEIILLHTWLKSVESQAFSHPWISIYLAWTLVQTGQQEKAATILDQVEQGDLTAASPVELQEMHGHIAAIRAHIAAYRWDATSAIGFAKQALDLLPANNLSIRSFVAQVAGSAYLLIGDPESARAGLSEARRMGLAAGNLHVAVLATFMLGNLLVDQGRLHEAVEMHQEALKWATTPSGQLLPVAARAFNGLSGIHFEWNELEKASQNARQCIALSQKWGNFNTLTSAYVIQALVKQAQGDLPGAQSSLNEAVRITQDHSLAPGGASSVETFQVTLWLATGNLEAAVRWVQKKGYKIEDDIPPLLDGEYRTFARVLLAQNEPDAALKLIDRLLASSETNARTGALIGLLILQSLALQMKNDIPQALHSFERALILAQPEGYVRTFLDNGDPVVKLLRHAGSKGIAPKYVSRLLSEYEKTAGPAPLPKQPLIEPLSERELEVLRLMAEGRSNQEIAAQLVLSTGTVKSHLSHIFTKLNVDSRTQCVARARELKLLS